MATYLALNGAVLGAVLILVIMHRRLYAPKPVLAALTLLLLLTAIFDNVIITSGIVAYDQSLTTGLKLVKAPLEDFAYCIAAALLMPLLWVKMGSK